MKAPILFSLITTVLAVQPVMAAQTLSFNLNGVTQSGVTPPTISLPTSAWSYVNFSEISNNQVEMKVGAGLVGDEFISMVGFNVNPTLNLNQLSFSNSSQSGNFTLPNISIDKNNIHGGGGTRFDIRLSFATSNSGNGVKRFNGEDWVSYTITYLGQGSFTSNSFNFFDTTSQFNTIAHVQSIGVRDTSAWITNCGPGVLVPEPSSAFLLGLGSLTLLCRSRK